MSANPWNAETVEKLSALHKQGLSASQIAKALGGGLTRNAVIGKIYRLGMGKIGGAKPAPPAKAPKAIKPPKVKLEPVQRMSRKEADAVQSMWMRAVARAKSGPLREAPPPSDKIAVSPIPWTERGFGFCAAPVGGKGADTLSCGNKCGPDETYCPGHKARFFVKPKDARDMARTLRRFAA